MCWTEQTEKALENRRQHLHGLTLLQATAQAQDMASTSAHMALSIIPKEQAAPIAP